MLFHLTYARVIATTTPVSNIKLLNAKVSFGLVQEEVLTVKLTLWWLCVMASVPGSDISVQEQYSPLNAVRLSEPAILAPPLKTHSRR
jgi:hypothetical protein